MIFPWWLILDLAVVLLATVLPPRGAALIDHPWGDEPAAEGGGRMARRDDWLARLKMACDAGYYKVDGPQAPPPRTASCRDCLFWRDDYCRLLSARRLGEDAICPFFYEQAAVGAAERHSDEAPG
ncbi:MAG: hypothetical protein JOZ41_10970 [Chloroflexi bacterium]|nr:hypothetical protein [Chloroflexota bacterium]